MRNGGELSDLSIFLWKQNIQNISRLRTRAPLISLGPLNSIILDLNKPLTMRNGGQLSDLECLPMKTENMEYLQNTATHTPHLFGPFTRHNIRSKQV